MATITTSQSFIETVFKTILDYKMLRSKEKVLVGVSGGPDSVALTLSLLSLKKKLSLNIGIAHLNHMLRGEESLRDEAFVKKLAHGLGLLFHSVRIDVKTQAKKQKKSIEEAGRDARYAFFETTAKNHGFTKIATGHTKDDNAEQVLMNLLRGAGPKGLSGIPPIRDNRYIRPLIRIPKRKILDFLKYENQVYMFDSSNMQNIYMRNKIRNKLIPYLQSEYNPEIVDAVDRMSHIIKQEESFLNNQTKEKFHTCLIKADTHCITFSKSALSNLHPALLNRIFRMAILIVKKDLKRFSHTHINDMIDFCFHHPSGVSLDLPGQIRIYKKKESIIIKKEAAPLREVGKKQKQLRQMIKKD